MSARGILFSLFLLLFVCLNEVSCSHANAMAENGTAGVGTAEMVPAAAGKAEMRMMIMLDERRRLGGSFQICALCTCCGGAQGYCLPSPCCYAINCNIPNRPFGFCAFTPKTCNCFGCRNL